MVRLKKYAGGTTASGSNAFRVSLTTCRARFLGVAKTLLLLRRMGRLQTCASV